MQIVILTEKNVNWCICVTLLSCHDTPLHVMVTRVCPFHTCSTVVASVLAQYGLVLVHTQCHNYTELFQAILALVEVHYILKSVTELP